MIWEWVALAGLSALDVLFLLAWYTGKDAMATVAIENRSPLLSIPKKSDPKRAAGFCWVMFGMTFLVIGVIGAGDTPLGPWRWEFRQTFATILFLMTALCFLVAASITLFFRPIFLVPSFLRKDSGDEQFL